MARYADVDKLIWQVQNSDKYGTITKEVFVSLLQNADTAEVAPVVHAYNKSKDSFLCSACTFGDFGLFNHGGKYTPKYCPYCGAKMDEEVPE